MDPTDADQDLEVAEVDQDYVLTKASWVHACMFAECWFVPCLRHAFEHPLVQAQELRIECSGSADVLVRVRDLAAAAAGAAHHSHGEAARACAVG